MLFSELPLDPSLQRAVAAAGFTTPTPIQEAALPLGLAGRDIIGTASTGTGKTVAFVLPILQRLITQPRRGRHTRALILTPTRELAEQIHQTIQQLARYTRLRSATVYGGVGFGHQDGALRSGAEIIVACPGRLIDHLERGTAQLGGVEMLVLDEADRMFDMGFLPSVKWIISQLPTDRQTMLYSATFAPELKSLAAESQRDSARVDVGVGVAARTVAHALYPVPQHLKTELLFELITSLEAESILIFTRTKHRANKLFDYLERWGLKVGALHAGKSQNHRQATLNAFRAGKIQLLVATDIAARGLDVETVSHVINFDIPDTVDTYIHRIGRTGRAERDGDALTLVTREDRGMVVAIERVLKAKIERRVLENFDYDRADAGPQGRTSNRRGMSGQRDDRDNYAQGPDTSMSRRGLEERGNPYLQPSQPQVDERPRRTPRPEAAPRREASATPRPEERPRREGTPTRTDDRPRRISTSPRREGARRTTVKDQPSSGVISA